MVDLQVTGTNGMGSSLGESTLEEFQKSLRGQIIGPGDDDYDSARQIWNANIDKHPALIARCVGVADVLDCVNFARDNNLLVSVRGGGHSFPGTCVADGGLVIDLSQMKSVRVDPVRRTARAEGGTKWGQFDRETQAFGLASTGGTNYDTGIGGLTLGGGMGWLAGKHGLALDNLISVDIVTADGQLRIASATENPDLFWAVRGGGGNFGVVTSFEYQLHPVGPLLVGLVIFPLEQAMEVLRFYHEFASSIPDEVNTASGLATLEDGTPAVAIVACYNGPLDEGEKVLEPLRKLGQPIMAQFGPLPYVQVQHMLDPFTPEGNQYYEKGHFIVDITDGAIDALVESYRNTSSPGNLLIFQQQGNAVNRVPQDVTAYSHRDARYNLILIARWADPGESEIHFRWTRELWEELAPYSTGGVYVNNVGSEADDGATMIRSAYGANYPRLAQVKAKYDPTNFFRHNQNIKPAV
jgi:FAD/FMN-containing dehydrogenase